MFDQREISKQDDEEETPYRTTKRAYANCDSNGRKLEGW